MNLNWTWELKFLIYLLRLRWYVHLTHSLSSHLYLYLYSMLTFDIIILCYFSLTNVILTCLYKILKSHLFFNRCHVMHLLAIFLAIIKNRLIILVLLEPKWTYIWSWQLSNVNWGEFMEYQFKLFTISKLSLYNFYTDIFICFFKNNFNIFLQIHTTIYVRICKKKLNKIIFLIKKDENITIKTKNYKMTALELWAILLWRHICPWYGSYK